MLSVKDEQISFSIQTNVEDVYPSIRKVQTILFRTLGLLRRLGLPPRLDAAINKLMQFIAVLNSARLAMIAFQAASGPIGWGLAAVGVAATIVSVTDLYESGAG